MASHSPPPRAPPFVVSLVTAPTRDTPSPPALPRQENGSRRSASGRLAGSLGAPLARRPSNVSSLRALSHHHARRRVGRQRCRQRRAFLLAHPRRRGGPRIHLREESRLAQANEDAVATHPEPHQDEPTSRHDANFDRDAHDAAVVELGLVQGHLVEEEDGVAFHEHGPYRPAARPWGPGGRHRGGVRRELRSRDGVLDEVDGAAVVW